MVHYRLYKRRVIFGLILVLGAGLALALPWSASSQSQAAQAEAGAQASFMDQRDQGKRLRSSPPAEDQPAPDSEQSPEAAAIYYVAKTGDGSNPTLGWSTAFTNVQDALSAAILTNGGEIWVAAGVYYPDQGVGQIENERISTFVLKDNVRLYGGFDNGDTKLSERDWDINLTVLSGDIDGNDASGTDGVVTNAANINGDNAYHVVSASGVTGSAVLDGFTITGGQAIGIRFPSDRGGGFHCDGSGDSNDCSPSLSNVTFSGNLAWSSGGAMENDGHNNGKSSPSLRNVTFSGNSAAHGGAMANYCEFGGNSSPRLTNVTFSGNSADFKGGGMNNNGGFDGSSSPILINVNFSGNSADRGGAMYNDGDQGSSSPKLTNVSFSGNSADTSGGAMYNYGNSFGSSSPSLTNVVFSGNSAGSSGGAMYNTGLSFGRSSPSLSNVTFSGNSAGIDGGAMYNKSTAYGICKPVLRNSILWNNQDKSGTGTISATIFNNSAAISLTHSLAQGAGVSGSSWTLDPSFEDGGGNIDSDPKFIKPVNPADAPSTAGNLRLKRGSPAIDAGEDAFVTGVETDLDGDRRIVDGDLDGTPTVDMGAYEYQIEELFVPLVFR